MKQNDLKTALRQFEIACLNTHPDRWKSKLDDYTAEQITEILWTLRVQVMDNAPPRGIDRHFFSEYCKCLYHMSCLHVRKMKNPKTSLPKIYDDYEKVARLMKGKITKLMRSHQP